MLQLGYDLPCRPGVNRVMKIHAAYENSCLENACGGNVLLRCYGIECKNSSQLVRLCFHIFCAGRPIIVHVYMPPTFQSARSGRSILKIEPTVDDENVATMFSHGVIYFSNGFL